MTHQVVTVSWCAVPRAVRTTQSCARTIISTLARRAYRRPVTESDVQPLLEIYRHGRGESDFEAGIGLVLEAVLSSPSFLIRHGRRAADATPGTVYRLSDLELASRLSFFCGEASLMMSCWTPPRGGR